VWKVPQAIAGEAKHLLRKAKIETGMELDGPTTRMSSGLMSFLLGSMTVF
jgi:hypothetical protein